MTKTIQIKKIKQNISLGFLIVLICSALLGCNLSAKISGGPENDSTLRDETAISSKDSLTIEITEPQSEGSSSVETTKPELISESIPVSESVTASESAPAPSQTTSSGITTEQATSLTMTNWTLNASGQILWYEKAPAMIAYNPAKIVSVTIPEGYTLVDICKLLEKKGVQTFYHTFSAALNGDYPSYSFTEASRKTANRRYALEGYLFPDTYQFHVGEKPVNIWAKFLSRTNAVLASYTPYPGMTMDQVLTLASLIEEEAFTGDTRANVSSVLHNRLKAGKKLELDKTINYVEWYIKPLIQSSDATVINAYNSFYNTYKCAALPAGPISNPGRLGIEAALNPAATDYLYFVTDTAGNYYYASTWEQHLANLATVGLS